MPNDPWTSRDGQWDRISTLFEMVLSLPPEERSAFIEVSCGSDRELRGEIESLVAAHDGAPAFLDGFHADVVHPALAQGDLHAETDGAADVPPAPSVAPGDRIRHFVVHERLGSGGAGVVYRGRDTLLARDVAIKFLAPSLSRDLAARARLVREAQAASRLDDPHVCPIYAVESTVDGGLCIVMAYCAGGTLRERLRRGVIPLAEINRVAQHLAHGLASAHHAGIVHGDIKPANVGFGDGDVARLLDFGVAIHAHEAAGGTGGLSGTLPYLAPELWRGDTRGPRTDVWALGVTFFEMVTGHRPFTGADPAALRETILAGHVLPMVRADGTSIAPPLESLIRRMLSTIPEERPADGAAVLAALAPADAAPFSANGIMPASAPSIDAAHTAGARHASLNRRIALSVVVAGALALAGGAMMSSTPQDAVSPPAIEVARTSLPLSSIAVLPFTTRGGRNIEYLADGMVDLLTPAFDNTGLVRGIDPNTVLGAAGDRRTTPLDSAAARALAVRIRADRYVVGSVVATGATLTFRATLRTIDGREIGRAQTTVADSGALVPGIDALVRQLIATELLAPGDTIAGIAAATTTSTRALRDYLDGERELRDARPAAAVAKFSDAVAADSMFALAWYRLARAARWNDVDSLSARAARKAAQLAASLPPRQQSLIRAYHTLRFGSAVQAERQFAQIVADYPSDVEAWMLLGEVQFGSNPYYGRPIEESSAAFQRVMALDPRNREVTVYLMDLAANADRTGQLDTLYSMYFSPNSAGEQPGVRATYTALYRRRIPASGPKRGSATPIDEPGLARVALQRISTDIRDRAAARAYAGVLAAGPTTRSDGLLTLATLDVANGQWDAAGAQYGSAALLDPDLAAEQRALSALAPSVVVGADTVRALRRVLLSRRAVPVPSGGDLSPIERDDLRQYLVGLLSVRLGDAAGVTAALQTLMKRPVADSSRLGSALSQAVAGHWQLRQGNLEAAMAAFEGSIPDLPARLRLQHPVLGQHLDRLARAETLRRLGRRDEARRWYESVREGFGVVGAPFVASADSGVRATTMR